MSQVAHRRRSSHQMYLDLFKKHVQPGVSMLLDMSKHVGSTDQVSITQAEMDLQNWSEAAHQGMIALIKEVCTPSDYLKTRRRFKMSCAENR